MEALETQCREYSRRPAAGLSGPLYALPQIELGMRYAGEHGAPEANPANIQRSTLGCETRVGFGIARRL